MKRREVATITDTLGQKIATRAMRSKEVATVSVQANENSSNF
jgi:hypothetical protein